MSEQHTLTDQGTAFALYLDALFAPLPEVEEGSSPVPGSGAGTVPSPTPAAPVAGASAAALVDAGEAPGHAIPRIAPGFRGDCLVAEHRSLRLALPMQSLAAILPAPAEYARLPGQAAWLHGMVRHRGHNVPVLSADLLVARPEGEAPASGRHNAQVVVLGSGRWAVHLDHVAGMRTVGPADCRLREHRDRLPWLAGYLTQGLVSLIDLAGLEAWLDDLAHGMDTARALCNGRRRRVLDVIATIPRQETDP